MTKFTHIFPNVWKYDFMTTELYTYWTELENRVDFGE